MQCPFCGEDQDRVVDSRSAERGRMIRRRRHCLSCNRRFTTHERVESAVKLNVAKKDGSRVPYDRGKLIAGLEKALYKRPVAAERQQELVEAIEDELFRTYDREVESHDIGRLVSEHLKQVDQVAYVRYASVYKQFRDLEDLFDEVQTMMNARNPLEGPDQGKLF